MRWTGVSEDNEENSLVDHPQQLEYINVVKVCIFKLLKCFDQTYFTYKSIKSKTNG